MAYELRPATGDGALEVFRVSEEGPPPDAELLGRLIRGRQGWRPEMEKRDRLREQLVVIARAWNRALVLHK